MSLSGEEQAGRSADLFRIHVAVLLFGMAGLFGKLLDLPSLVIVFGRVLFASLFLFLSLLSARERIRLPSPGEYASLALPGLLLAFHWFAFFESIKLSTVAVGLLTFSTFPVFTALLEPLLSGEKFRIRDLVAALVALFGVALVVPDFSPGSDPGRGVLWGVLSGASFGLLSIMNRRYVRTYPGKVIALYQDLGAAVLLLPLCLLSEFRLDVQQISLLLLLGVIFTGVSHSLFISGLRTVSARAASIIVTLEPVYGIIAAVLLLDETPTLVMITGGLLILGAALYETAMHRSA